MSQARNHIKDCSMGIVIATLLSAVLVLLVALFTKFFPVSDGVVPVLNIVVKGISVFLGVLTQIKSGGKGLIKGAIVGIVFSLISLLILILLGGAFDFGSYAIDLGICLGVGALSGILAASRKKA